MVTNLCNAANTPNTPTSAPLDMMFYAGRVADFGALTDALESRTCRQQPLTILFAATGGVTIAQEYKDRLAKSNVTVVVATPSDSAAWGKNGPGTPADYAPFLAAYHDRGFLDDGDLLDGYAIAHHDAFATAADAIRLGAQSRPTQAPTPQDVAAQFGHLNLAYAVRAAVGTLSFPSEGGRATGLPIPVTQIG